MNKIRLLNFIKTKTFIISASILAVVIAAYFLIFHRPVKYQFVTVTKGSVTETVTLTGNTEPTQSVSLGFGSSGTISKTNAELGQTVKAGTVLATLNLSDLSAQLAQARANVTIQQAKLESLQTGARPEDISLYKQKYYDAALALIIAMSNSELQVDSSITNNIDTLFNSSSETNPVLKITETYDERMATEKDYVSIKDRLQTWQKMISALNGNSDTKSISDAVTYGRETMNFVSRFLNTLVSYSNNFALTNSGLTQTELDAYNSTVNTAAQSVTTAASTLQTANAAWTSASATLVSEQSGSKPEDIKAQAASVAQAQASVNSVLAKIQNAEIIAPIDGSITQFDAKVGQEAVAGSALVSIMSDKGYEVHTGASETDVGKISLRNKVTMTIDALPNQTFTGTVFYIAPAQTNNEGVITYLTKISFDQLDPRIKSGFTVNINIETNHKDNVLVLPQYGILQNDQGTFVEILQKGKVVDVPVTLGIQDQKGNVEVISGVSEGEQVLNIGLKK